jgi:hypothetical protein
MKTTVELPDEAAQRGRRLKDMIEEGLRLVLATPREVPRRVRLAALMKEACGVVDSGIPDLGSNPKQIESFGRDARRNR